MAYDPYSWLTNGNDMMLSQFPSSMLGLNLTPNPSAFEKFSTSTPNMSSIEPIRSPFPDFFNPALFDEEGRYGITQDLRQDARWRGLGQLGASLIAGANSGSWGGMAKGLSMGMNAAGETNDAYLDKLSQQKLLQVKAQMDARKSQQDYTMGELEYDVKDFTLGELKKKAAYNDAGIAEIKEQFNDNLNQMRAASTMATDPGLKKNLNQIIDSLEVAVKAGDVEAYQQGLALWMKNAPDQSKALMDQMFAAKRSDAQAETEGALLGQMNAAKTLQADGQLPEGAKGDFRNGRYIILSKAEQEEEAARMAVLKQQLANAQKEKGAPSQIAIANKQMQLDAMRAESAKLQVDYSVKEAEVKRLEEIKKQGQSTLYAAGYDSPGEITKKIDDIRAEMARLQGYRALQEDKIKETESIVQSLIETGRSTGELPQASTRETIEAKLDAFEAQPQYKMSNQVNRKKKLRDDALAAVDADRGMTPQEKNEFIKIINSRWPITK